MRRRVSGPVEFFGRQRPQLLVGLEQLHLAVADLQRLPMPLAQLLGEPDGVLLGVEHVEDVGRRIDPRPAGKIIFDEQPHLHRLRLDAERLGGERAGQFEHSLSGPPAASMRSPAAGA